MVDKVDCIKLSRGGLHSFRWIFFWTPLLCLNIANHLVLRGLFISFYNDSCRLNINLLILSTAFYLQFTICLVNSKTEGLDISLWMKLWKTQMERCENSVTEECVIKESAVWISLSHRSEDIHFVFWVVTLCKLVGRY